MATAKPDEGQRNLLGVPSCLGTHQAICATNVAAATTHVHLGRSRGQAGGGHGLKVRLGALGGATVRQARVSGMLAGQTIPARPYNHNIVGKSRGKETCDAADALDEATGSLLVRRPAVWGSPGTCGNLNMGPGPVGLEIRGKIVVELGAKLQHPKTTARVYGYGPGFGLNACEDGSYAQQERRQACPSVDVKLTDSQHMTRTCLHRPTFGLTQDGVPQE